MSHRSATTSDVIIPLEEGCSATFSTGESSKLLTLGDGEERPSRSRRRGRKSLSARFTSWAHDFSRVMSGAHLNVPTTFTNVDDILGLIFEFAGADACRERLLLVNHQWRGVVLDIPGVQAAMEARVSYFNSRIDRYVRPINRFYFLNALITIVTFLALYPFLYLVFFGRDRAKDEGRYDSMLGGYVMCIVFSSLVAVAVLMGAGGVLYSAMEDYQRNRYLQLTLHLVRGAALYAMLVTGATFLSQFMVLDIYTQRGMPPMVAECPRRFGMSMPSFVKFVDPSHWNLSKVMTHESYESDGDGGLLWYSFSYRNATYLGETYPMDCGKAWGGKPIPPVGLSGSPEWCELIRLAINFELNESEKTLALPPNATLQVATNIFWLGNDGANGRAARDWEGFRSWTELAMPLITSLEPVPPETLWGRAALFGYWLPPIVFWVSPLVQAVFWVAWYFYHEGHKLPLVKGVKHVLPLAQLSTQTRFVDGSPRYRRMEDLVIVTDV